MKKSRIIALFTAAVMIMSLVPAFASDVTGAGYIVAEDGTVLAKDGENLVLNPGFEEGLKGLTENSEYYEISDSFAHSGQNSLAAIKSTKGIGSLRAYFPVSDAGESYYLSFWYLNTDTTARRPRVTFAFTDSSRAVPTEEDDFTDETNAWVGMGNSSNAGNGTMPYSKGEWVRYSTVIKGNGDSLKCAYAVLDIYGLTKDVSFIDDVEVYRLKESAKNEVFSKALDEWKSIDAPKGPYAGRGTISLTKEITSVSGVSVKWSSSSECIDVEAGEFVSGKDTTLAVLTARVYMDGYYDEIYKDFEYPCIVKSMFEPYISFVNSEFDKIGTSIKSDIVFATSKTEENYPDATIEWYCSDSAVLTPEGKFTPPETTEYVNLSAVITCGDVVSDPITRRVKAIGGNIIPDGLVMYYDFESALGTSSKLYNVSGSERNYDAKAEGVAINNGYAYFNGSSTIVLPSHYATELNGSYTVSQWVKVDNSIATSSGMYRFFDFGGGTRTSQFLRYIPASGQLSFMDRSIASDANDFQIDTNLSGIAGTWKLMTLVYDYSGSSAEARLYVDGESIAVSTGNNLTKTVYDLAGASSTTGYIGRTQWYDNSNPDFVGYMDDVRIYNRALTSDEITTLYNETRPTVTANVTIKYVDKDGNELKGDAVVQCDVDTTYDVPSSLKSIASYSEGGYRYTYKLIASKSIDSVYVTSSGDNTCTLVFELTKSLQGSNLIQNGSFTDGTAGWTNRVGTDIVGAEVVYDSEIGANAMCIKTLGKDSTQSIGTIWTVEKGKTYTLSFDVGGAKPESGNYVYNRISDSFNYVEGHYENAGTDLVKFGEEMTDGAWTHFSTTFVAQTDTVYIQSSWAKNTMKFANFVLEENTSGGDTPEDPDDGTSVPVVVRFRDLEGSTIKDDVVVKVAKGTQTYTAPASVIALEDKVEGSLIYKYVYLEEESSPSVGISVLYDNVVTLVYDVIKASKTSNIMVDGGFDNGSGSFSWGNWQSPETGEYFRNKCEEWFYVVDRDTNSATRYNAASLPKANDYALGTLWNDGITGLCSMANFVKVQAGKTYIVSYDYKHNTAGTDASYISTSFVETNEDLSANPEGYNIPKNVSTQWQTNSFVITAPTDGYIYFHFSYLGSGGSTNTGENNGGGPHWYFDNFEVLEVITFENKMAYTNGYAEILAEDGTTGYLVQALYDNDGALASVKVSEKLTLNQETPVAVKVTEGAKLILVNDLASLTPICPAITAE